MHFRVPCPFCRPTLRRPLGRDGSGRGTCPLCKGTGYVWGQVHRRGGTLHVVLDFGLG